MCNSVSKKYCQNTLPSLPSSLMSPLTEHTREVKIPRFRPETERLKSKTKENKLTKRVVWFNGICMKVSQIVSQKTCSL